MIYVKWCYFIIIFQLLCCSRATYFSREIMFNTRGEIKTQDNKFLDKESDNQPNVTYLKYFEHFIFVFFNINSEPPNCLDRPYISYYIFYNDCTSYTNFAIIIKKIYLILMMIDYLIMQPSINNDSFFFFLTKINNDSW
jgi:hypothetical protein